MVLPVLGRRAGPPGPVRRVVHRRGTRDAEGVLTVGANDGNYHTLLARHEAMRLRRHLLSPGNTADAGGAVGAPAGEPYDGEADRRTIMRDLDLVAPFDELITHLYRALFARHPSLRSLFPASMEFQQAHLARALWFLIEHLDRPDEITGTFTQLGRDHRRLGLRPAQYAAFETALCEALRVRAGEHWTAELEQAWVRMLRFGVAAMVQGAEAALREPPFWRATVTEHRLRGPDLAVLRVRPHETFRYRAGQYVALESARLPHTWRPYYPAGVPGRDGELEFHVRRTGPGGVSEALVRRTGTGDEVRIGPPKGNLALGEEPFGGLQLVAWDTGWAAMKALLQELEGRVRQVPGHRTRRVRLFVGADALVGLYDAEYLTGLEQRRSWLTVVPVTGGAPGEGGYDRLVHAVTGSGPLPAGRTLVAGPPEMVRAVTAALTRAGLPAEDLRHDLPPAGPHDVPRPVGDLGPAGAPVPPGRAVPV